MERRMEGWRRKRCWVRGVWFGIMFGRMFDGVPRQASRWKRTWAQYWASLRGASGPLCTEESHRITIIAWSKIII
jgi:hypothetical protein